MTDELNCFRCGESLAALTPPLSRQDVCPACGCYLHACRMCTNFAPHVPTQCREDDAEEVLDKDKSNFCEWFEPSPTAFDGNSSRTDDDARNAAEDLFR